MTKKEVQKTVEDWMSILGLLHWEINISFDEVKNPVVKGEYAEEASCNSCVEYLTATLNFRPSRLKKMKPETIIHELLHCVLAEMAGYMRANLKEDDKWLEYFHERTTSHLTQAFTNYHTWLKHHK